MTNKQQALAIASMIGSILDMYKPEERDKSINELLRVIHRFMRKYVNQNMEEFKETVLLSDKVWQNTVNHYADKGVSIEAITTVVALFNLYADKLAKHANVTEKRIEAYAKTSKHDFTELEANSNEVAEHLINGLAEYTGVRPKDLSHLKRNAQTKSKLKAMDAILEGAA